MKWILIAVWCILSVALASQYPASLAPSLMRRTELHKRAPGKKGKGTKKAGSTKADQQGSPRQETQQAGHSGSRRTSQAQPPGRSTQQAGPSSSQGSSQAQPPVLSSSRALVKYVPPHERPPLYRPESPPRPRKANTQTSVPQNSALVQNLRNTQAEFQSASARGRWKPVNDKAKEEAAKKYKDESKKKLAEATKARHRANDARRQFGPSDEKTFDAMRRFDWKTTKAIEAVQKAQDTLGMTNSPGYISGLRSSGRMGVRGAHKQAMQIQWYADRQKERADRDKLAADFGSKALEISKTNPRASIAPYDSDHNERDKAKAKQSRINSEGVQMLSDGIAQKYKERQKELNYALRLFPNDSSSDESEKSVKV